MIRWISFIGVLLTAPLFSNFVKESPSIIFVHIGEELPTYLPIAIKQARLFNDNSNIALVASLNALEINCTVLEEVGVISIPIESLQKSMHHKYFLKHSTLDRTFRGGFWLFASERFFYLHEVVKKYELRNVIHLESDVMLYENIEKLLPILEENYLGLAVPYSADNRCIPSIVFIKDDASIFRLIKYMAKQANLNLNDMTILGQFSCKDDNRYMASLPIVHREYIEKEEFESVNPDRFSNNVDQFNSIFDSAYLGQYLGGVDASVIDVTFGYVNPHCVIKSSKLKFSWKKDSRGRKVPFASYGGKVLKINNLHIHSKRLQDFSS